MTKCHLLKYIRCEITDRIVHNQTVNDDNLYYSCLIPTPNGTNLFFSPIIKLFRSQRLSREACTENSNVNYTIVNDCIICKCRAVIGKVSENNKLLFLRYLMQSYFDCTMYIIFQVNGQHISNFKSIGWKQGVSAVQKYNNAKYFYFCINPFLIIDSDIHTE